MAFPRLIDWTIYHTSYWAAWTGFTFGLSFRAGGRQHLPASGPALIVANHQSYLDPVLFGAGATRPLTYLARSTLFKKKLGAAIISAYGAIPIDRGFGREGLQTVFDALNAGRAVLMFPEGERTHDGNLQDLKAGVSLIVKKTTAPIIPAGIAGAYAMWPRQAKRPRLSPLVLPDRGSSVAVAFGEPVPAGIYHGMARDAILADLQARIAVAHAAAEKLRRKP
jgi:1-acyl-sn-glycerol-3-phosphate acyltransferase